MDDQALFDEAVRQYRAQQFDAAIDACQRLLARAPREYLPTKLLGLIYARQGRLLMAEEYLRMAQGSAQDDAEVARTLAAIENRRRELRADPYLHDFLRGRSVFRDYPRNISIETVGRCNAVCDFCPNPVLERRRKVMSEDLFRKIVADLQQIPAHHPLNIFPNLVNEPFMDRHIIERLSYINTELPRATLQIFTNLNVVHRDLFERLAGIRNIIAINISLNAANREEYERTMGIDFERTVGNLRRLMTLNRERGFFPKPLNLSRVSDGTEGDRRYIAEVAALFPEFTPNVDFLARYKQRTDWLGRVDTQPSYVPHWAPCGAWFDLDITCEGTVLHCCMDAHGDYALGDVTRQSVLEVYNSPAFRAYRELLTAREQVHPCSTCSLVQ